MIRVCAWCDTKMGTLGKKPGATHGICKSCLKKLNEIENGAMSDWEPSSKVEYAVCHAS